MKAVAVSRFGASPELMELPTPAPGPGQVLVRLAGAGLNPFDWKVADGMLKDSAPHHFPLIMGVDGSGVVEAVGEGVELVRPGDSVYGQFMDLASGGGSYAEYAVTKAGSIALAPRSMPLPSAAAIPIASMTAYNLVESARVTAGQKILIIGATGGVGQGVTQFASTLGAHVIVTAGADMAPLMREYGAAETVDHLAGPVVASVRALHPEGVDVLVDLVQDATGFAAAADLVRPGGAALTTQGVADVGSLAERSIRAVNFNNTASASLLETLASLIDAGLYGVRIDAEVSLEQATAAIARNRAGGARGKTIIRIA
ncbi:NADP-dependent oxidoreductase [Nonomuraea soli]|uniref:NADPH:quinone reductase-like Zn-dependent oxidoreductase n=1 Tax=Nonomuraea soli TaxID=1032476 RepID=A0A7W0CM47_9ACTN|nr:NADP-dependent oxidoreductase [Nonomuraea soli]MBA2893688.1 NADPH:quinone reductase-like Zn-dependent oxidoreductase [Nonomuraea soli]